MRYSRIPTRPVGTYGAVALLPRLAKYFFLLLAIAGITRPALAQLPPTPAPDPGSTDQNLFYGATPQNAANAPVLVFVPGLKGTASDWWISNDMYQKAFDSGYRTAFMSMSVDNSRNDASTAANAAVITNLLPKIVARFNVPKVYLIGHSKGGLDIQAAMLNPAISKLVRAVFTIDTPNQGTELADCAVGPPGTLCFTIAQKYGLQSPAVQSLTTKTVAAFRAQADPIFAGLGIPFYTIAGTTSLANPITIATGVVLSQITDKSVRNDGLVTVPRSQLPFDYATEIAEVFANHFSAMQGSISWPYIWGRIVAAEQQMISAGPWTRIATNGFGDYANTFAWSMKWFKGQLYVGTGRMEDCVSVADFAVQENYSRVYPPIGNNCTPDPKDLPLQAEIWQYTPQTKKWLRVFQSPNNIPLGLDQNGNPAFTAPEIGIRGMAVFTEPDGTQALYAAGVGASSVFENVPPYDVQGYPSPRILRSVDGVNWAPIPMDAGTFLGDLSKNSPHEWKVRGFRDLTVYNGKLYASASDYYGTGIIIGSSNPKLGDDAWQMYSPALPALPVRTLYVWNNYLYILAGDRRITQPDASGKQFPVGYSIYKTTNPTTDVSSFTPIITNGAGLPLSQRSPTALSAQEFQGQLYIGTDRPTELVRLNPDDSWDLIFGNPRQTDQGYKAPLSGTGTGLGNSFIGHLYQMSVYENQLHIGTWDWSLSLRGIPIISDLFTYEFGFDLLKSPDGVHWTAVSRDGFNDPFNFGIRSFQSTKYGLFLGTTRPTGGTQIWLDNSVLDYNHDGGIDQRDVNVIMSALNQPASGPDDPRDLDSDGKITVADARALITQCTLPGCAAVAPVPAPLPAPVLSALTSNLTGGNVVLNWTSVPGALKYHVYLSIDTPLLNFLPADGIVAPIPGTGTSFRLPQDVLNGTMDPYCPAGSPQNTIPCLVIGVVKGLNNNPGLALPAPWGEVVATSNLTVSLPAPTVDQSRFYVVAEDAQGRLSLPSNTVGAPGFSPVEP